MNGTQGLTETNWKPKRWVAILLSLVALPFSMLYLARPRLALYYFVAALVISLAEFWLVTTGVATWLKYVPITWLLPVICAIHSYRLTKHGAFPLPRVWYSRWYGMVAIVGGFAIVVLGGRSFLYEPFSMPSVSMLPTLPAKAIVIVQKLGFGNYGTFGVSLVRRPLSEKVEHGDIIVFQYPLDPKIDYVKRVIGLPGDFVSYKQKTLYINNVKVQITPREDKESEQTIDERYGDKSWQTIVKPDMVPRDFEGNVPEHQYFVLGDNRDNSSDSRYWGFVPEENIVGKVVYVSK